MSSHSRAYFAVLGSFLLASVACSKGEKAEPPASEQAPSAVAPVVAAPSPAATAKGEAITMFRSRCVVCHGEKGKGDGPGAAALEPKPRNYSDGAWQASVTDEQIKNVIMYGGAAAGKSPIMPASPDLQSKPEVVDELVKIVRSFKP
jgi:mono/diheme cytochrome c family protein